MRYRNVALVIPKSRSNDIRYTKSKRIKNNVIKIEAPKVEHHKIKGSGVIEDALEIYNKKKGAGLKLAGQGLNPAGGGLDLPGGALKMKLLKESRGADITGSYPMVNKTLGSGMKMTNRMKGLGAEGVNQIQTMLKTVVIPKLMEHAGVNDIVPQTLINKVVDVSTKDPSNTIKDVIEHLSKSILPIITQSKLAQTGSGKHYSKIIKHKNYKKMHPALKKFIKAELRGQNGGSFASFFSGLWDGFKSIIKPIAKIAGPVASFLLPEFSPAIGLASSVIGNL